VVSEGAAWVAAWYWDSRLVNVVYAVFNNSIINYNVLITGNSGVGKTTYAYYGLKVGYIKFLLANRCSERGGVYCVEGNARRDFNEELKEFEWRHVPLFDEARDWVWRRVLANHLLNALEELERDYGEICIGPDCSKPDGIDEKLRVAMFVGEDDVAAMTELLAKVLRGEAKPPKALLLDDALYRNQYFDPEYRRLYMLVKDLLAHHRGIVPLMIATGILRSTVLKDYVKASRNVEADAVTRVEQVPDLESHTVQEREVHYVKYWWWRVFKAGVRRYNVELNTSTTHITYGYTVDTVDYIPKGRAFKMPKWFEESHWVRRKLILLRAVERYRKARKAKETEG